MPKYTETKLPTFQLETEGRTLDVENVVDSYDTVTLTFGASFTLRLDYNNIEKLEEALVTARRLIQDQTIDQAGEGFAQSEPLSAPRADDGDAFNDPGSW
jgi:hypothetical protein